MYCNICETKKSEEEMKTKTKCKECHKKKRAEYMRNYNAVPENNEKRNKNRRDIQHSDPLAKEKKRESDKKYYEKNKQEIRAKYNHEYHTNPLAKEKKRESDKKYSEQVKNDPVKLEKRRESARKSAKKRRSTPEGIEKAREQKRRYCKNNRTKINDYRKEQRKTNEQFRLADNLRKAVRRVISAHGIQKTWKGEITKELTQAIIDKLGPRPTPDHHLDHIIPITAFDLRLKEHRTMANDPENLRWLLGLENLSKKDKIDLDLINESPTLICFAKLIGIIV